MNNLKCLSNQPNRVGRRGFSAICKGGTWKRFAVLMSNLKTPIRLATTRIILCDSVERQTDTTRK